MRLIRGLISFGRDILKDLFLFCVQILTRCFYLNRQLGSSISLSARLDVIPRGKESKRHRLLCAKNSLIEKDCVVNTWFGNVSLGEGSNIGIGSVVIGPVAVGKNCSFAQNCLVTGESHRYEGVETGFREQGYDVKPVVIKDDVWVGANCIILPGVTIGSHSVVGAGAVVTKDIPSYCLVAGNPARILKYYDKKFKQWISTSQQ